jgi:hypothetical protein
MVFLYMAPGVEKVVLGADPRIHGCPIKSGMTTRTKPAGARVLL